jgi:hypothetical protein
MNTSNSHSSNFVNWVKKNNLKVKLFFIFLTLILIYFNESLRIFLCFTLVFELIDLGLLLFRRYKNKN